MDFIMGLLVGIALTALVIWEIGEYKLEKYLNRMEKDD